MNKELSPLEALERIRSHNYHEHNKKECLSIIETALKEKETQDSIIKTLKEVIEFAQIVPHIEPNEDNGFDIMSAVAINIRRDIENRERELLRQWVLETCFPKEVKALEIIKKKRVNIHLLFLSDNLKQYNFNLLSYRRLTYEEYDLLKEVLL